MFAVVSLVPRHVMMVMVLVVTGTYTGRARRWFGEYDQTTGFGPKHT